MSTPRSRRRGHVERAGIPALGTILLDVRSAARSLAKRPGFLAVAVFSLAVGIGANVAIFSIVNAVFIRQYPFRDPDRLVRVYTRVPHRTEFGTTSFPNYLDLKGLGGPFESVGAYKTVLSRIELPDGPVRVMGEAVSESLFPLLGVDAAVGRMFHPDEDRVPGAHPVVVLGHGFWKNALGADPRIVGAPVRIAGHVFTVVGVAPEGYHGLSGAGFDAGFFVPLVMYATASGTSDTSHLDDRMDRRYNVVGRLADGSTLDGARARLQVFGRRLTEAYPEAGHEWSFTMVPLADVALGDPDVDGALRPFAALLMAAGGILLLLACTNLASFLMTRGVSRRKEIALRLALGAGRGRLVRHALSETMLLGLLGGVAGLAVAHWTTRLLLRFRPSLPVPFTLDLTLDHTVLLFTLGLAVATGLLLGVAPALHTTDLSLAPVLRGGMGLGGPRRSRVRNGLISLQVALSVVLLVGGGMSLRSLRAARQADLGFATRRAGVAWIDLSLSGVPPAEYGVVRDELTRRARALPGVDAVTAATHIPLFGSASGGYYTVAGADPADRAEAYNVQREEVDADYFATMGIRMVAGRSFTTDDRPNSVRVAIVNETAADRLWPGQDPLGQELLPLGSGRGYRVVGVARDTRVERLREAAKPLLYLPITQVSDPDLLLVARGGPASAEIAGMLRTMIREVDPALMVMETTTMEERIGAILSPGRLAALLLGVFGILALILATVGLYGVVSFSVSQRTREMAVRLSVGATARAVVGTVVGRAMRLVAFGGVVGLAVALGLAQLLRRVFYGVAPVDAVTVVTACLFLAGAGAVAAWIPARRAGRVDPVTALRYE